MSKRIPATYKAQLGELLADWYRHFGKVAKRRPYHEDDPGGGSGDSTANKMFEDHPFLCDLPIGAPSDLSSVIVEDDRTLDEANDRENELNNELKNKLTLQNKLENKLENKHKHTLPTPKPEYL